VNTGSNLWTIPPGGTSCARLGNEQTNYGAERLMYSINVTATNCIFTYQYAVVLEDPAHSASDQPKFNIYVLDVNNNVIDPTCGVYEVSSQGGITGFQDATHAADGETTHWKNWTTVGVDLSAHIGSTIHIVFATYDCAQGAHFGYAYISCHCGAQQIQQQCSGASDILTAPAGFASYTWSTGGTSNTTTINNPVNGSTVTCTCTSVQGCQLILSIVLNIQPVVFTVNSSTICSGASTTLTASDPSFTYAWDGGQVGSSITVSPTTTTTYSVTATASGGCSNSSTATVTVNPLPDGNTTETPEGCGASDGTITANTTAGTGPFTYSWSSSPTQNPQTATGLAAGTYTCTITDANTCSTTISGPITTTTVMNVTTDSTDENCGQANGTATVVPNGGLGNFNYVWSTTPPQYSATAINLSAGTYTVTVTSGTCTSTAQVTINNLPGPSAGITNITNTTCSLANGGATVTVTGGSPGYIYLWNCVPPQTSNILSNVMAGTYTVTVTDVNNCMAMNTVNITDSPPPTASITSTDEICFQANGTATVTAMGGIGVYTYLWSNGQSTAAITGLTQGSYSVTVSDSNCTVIESVNVGEILGPTAGFSLHPRLLTLMDGPVSVTAYSSPSIVSWDWNFGDGTPDGIGSQTSHQYMNLGTYTITLIVTDNNGCTDTISDTVKIKDIYAFYIPNTFTPNSDGLNDLFTPHGISVDPDNYEEFIFDRWGNIIFHTRTWLGTSAEGWNGTKNNKGNDNDVIMDVYVYKILLKELDGYKHAYIGRISLIP